MFFAKGEKLMWEIVIPFNAEAKDVRSVSDEKTSGVLLG